MPTTDIPANKALQRSHRAAHSGSLAGCARSAALSASVAVMEGYQQSYQHILEAVNAMPERDLAGRFAWTKKRTFSVYVAACACDHYKWANDMIRKWAKAQKKNISEAKG